MSLDTQPILDGDDAFTGVNAKLERSKLRPGEVALAINKRLRTGSADTRPGTVMPVFANVMAIPAGNIRGAGLYSNPNGNETLLIATNTKVYRVRDGSAPIEVTLASPIGAGTPAEFVQAFDKVLLFRGLEKAPLQWDGVSAAGFLPIAKSKEDPSYTALIPNAVTAEAVAGRMLVPFEKDKVAVSDIGDYTIYDQTLEQFWLNTGTADRLVRIFPYSQRNVIVFKGASIALWGNFSDPASVTLEVIDRTVGLIGRKTPQIVGDGILFLSNPSGVRKLRQVVQGKIEVDPVPVSDAIEPIIRRINWRAAAGAVSALLGDYFYLAVPLDGATRNNAVLVLNTVTGQWESTPDQWGGALDLFDLKVADYLGAKALYAIDQVSSAIYVLYVDGATSDTLKSGEYQIADAIETRGYGGKTPEGEVAWKRFGRANLAVSTLNPSFTVTAVTDGVEEEKPLTNGPMTRDRTQYFTLGTPAYDPAATSGFLNPRREDYSAVLAGGIRTNSGITLGARQESTERLQIRMPGRWCSLRIENTQGQCNLRATSVEALPAGRNRRIA